MPRSQALLQLSREHHEALVLARRASAADPTSAAARQQREHLLARWPVQFEPHFAREEEVLLPALALAGHSAAADEALAQHTELRHLFERLRSGDLRALPVWGDAMQVHVRFEERALFPLAERSLDLAELADSMTRLTFTPAPST